MHLYSGIALPDWFISGGGVEMDELQTECAGEEGGSRTDAGKFKFATAVGKVRELSRLR